MFPKEHLQPYILVTPSLFQDANCSGLVFSRVRRFLNKHLQSSWMREKCHFSELFWSVFSSIWTKWGQILSISPHSVRMRENADQNNSEYGQFLRTQYFSFFEGIELIRKSSCSHPLHEICLFYCKRVIAATHSFRLTAAFLQSKNCSKKIS